MTGKSWDEASIRGNIPDSIPPNGVTIDVWNGQEQAWQQAKVVQRKDGERGQVLITQSEANIND